ncbi:MAG: ferritin-like domain-containing protein [Tepidimonas sp.]|uniref:ferritin-like domain-containing protein n=1 Tax=Tepidimonas sp. TaxID=2002775 RepID=UPI0040551A07
MRSTPTTAPPTSAVPAADARTWALHWLTEADPTAKVAGVRALQQSFWQGPPADTPPDRVAAQPDVILAPPSDRPLPGRPVRPRLIEPGKVPARSPFTLEGHAALIHAICHIEFNAINLALDAVWRFPGMPHAFYGDWLRVAAEEAEHFTLLRDHLRALVGPQGQRWDYGDFEAHDGLWAMCDKTAGDIIARMALVPRTLEARGLDATPLIQAKLQRAGTQAGRDACAILDVILHDEVGHVATGNRWYRWLCERAGLDPVTHYRNLTRRYRAPRPKPPFNTEARRRAGFTAEELADLERAP